MIYQKQPMDLEGTTPLCRGHERTVFEHPKQQNRLIKVMTGTRPDPPKWNLPQRIARNIAINDHRTIRREVSYYLQLMIAPPHDGLPPIAQIYGFVQTSKGPGMVVERIAPMDAVVGPTLRDIHSTGRLNAKMLRALNAVVADIDRWKIRASDLQPWNLVLGRRDGQMAFVLVDGFGDYSTLRLRTLSTRYNASANAKAFAGMGQRLGLKWDFQRRQFNA